MSGAIDDSPNAPRWAFACEPGWEAVLADELQCAFVGSIVSKLGDGWLLADLTSVARPSMPCIAFCTQCLPACEAIEAASISRWVEIVGPRLIERLAEYDGRWALQVFGVYFTGSPVGRRRCELIAAGINEFLMRKQRRLLRTQIDPRQPAPLDAALVQLGLVAPDSGFLSICPAAQRNALRRCVSPFLGGVVEIAADKRPPSRAFAKLLEAEIRLGRRIEAGQTCVDLGSSPGSWAHVALSRGATVTAVDRSPLRDDLMQNAGLTFIRGDAFRFQPAEPVDWLLSDVIAFPERILELIQTWVGRRWCRKFCVTVKFRGRDAYAKLEPIKAWLAANGAEFQIRRLTNNKNEVTALGEVRNAEGAENAEDEGRQF